MKKVIVGFVILIALGSFRFFMKKTKYLKKNLPEISLSTYKTSLVKRNYLRIFKPSSFDPNRPYNRREINKVFKKRVKEIHNAGLIGSRNGKTQLTDVFSKQRLQGGDKYEYDHIVSAKEVFLKYRHILTDEQIAIVANVPKNIGPTSVAINKSKGSKTTKEWLDKLKTKNELNLDSEVILSNYKTASLAIEKEADRLIREIIF